MFEYRGIMYKLDDRCHPPLTEEQETRYPVLNLDLSKRKWNLLWFCLVERGIFVFLLFYITLAFVLSILTILIILFVPKANLSTTGAIFISVYMLTGVVYLVTSYCLKNRVLYKQEKYIIRDQGFHHLIQPKEPCVIHVEIKGSDRKYIFPPEEV